MWVIERLDYTTRKLKKVILSVNLTHYTEGISPDLKGSSDAHKHWLSEYSFTVAVM